MCDIIYDIMDQYSGYTMFEKCMYDSVVKNMEGTDDIKRLAATIIIPEKIIRQAQECSLALVLYLDSYAPKNGAGIYDVRICRYALNNPLLPLDIRGWIVDRWRHGEGREEYHLLMRSCKSLVGISNRYVDYDCCGPDSANPQDISLGLVGLIPESASIMAYSNADTWIDIIRYQTNPDPEEGMLEAYGIGREVLLLKIFINASYFVKDYPYEIVGYLWLLKSAEHLCSIKLKYVSEIRKHLLRRIHEIKSSSRIALTNEISKKIVMLCSYMLACVTKRSIKISSRQDHSNGELPGKEEIDECFSFVKGFIDLRKDKAAKNEGYKTALRYKNIVADAKNSLSLELMRLIRGLTFDPAMIITEFLAIKYDHLDRLLYAVGLDDLTEQEQEEKLSAMRKSFTTEFIAIETRLSEDD